MPILYLQIHFILQRVAVLLGEEWIQALACVTEELLKSMDSQIVVDDVEVGRKLTAHFLVLLSLK